jgi:hypothetical protein
MRDGRVAKLKEALRLASNFLDEPFDFVVETAPQLCCDRGIILNCLDVFFPRVEMKNVRFHRPAILPTWADTSSPGVP